MRLNKKISLLNWFKSLLSFISSYLKRVISLGHIFKSRYVALFKFNQPQKDGSGWLYEGIFIF